MPQYFQTFINPLENDILFSNFSPQNDCWVTAGKVWRDYLHWAHVEAVSSVCCDGAVSCVWFLQWGAGVAGMQFPVSSAMTLKPMSGGWWLP